MNNTKDGTKRLSDGARALYDAVARNNADFKLGLTDSYSLSLREAAGEVARSLALDAGADEEEATKAALKAMSKTAMHGDPFRSLRKWADEINSLRGVGYDPVVVFENKIFIANESLTETYCSYLMSKAVAYLSRVADLKAAAQNQGQLIDPHIWGLEAKEASDQAFQLLIERSPEMAKEKYR